MRSCTSLLEGIGQMLVLLAAAVLLAGCASTDQLAAQATEGPDESCPMVQVRSYDDLFESVAQEHQEDVRIVGRALNEDDGYAEVTAAARRASEREIALRRADIPECLALVHLKAIQSAQEMSQATEMVLQGQPDKASELLRSSSDHLVKARRLLDQELSR